MIRLPASEAEGQGSPDRGPVANAALTTVVDAWGRARTPGCLTRSSGLIRRTVVDSCGPAHPPEKQTVEGQAAPLVTACPAHGP
jgi:hypothetical protein